MPQKRNPYALSIVRGGGGVLIGRLTGFLAVVKSPSARSDNLIFAYGEIPRALDLATKITGLMTGVVGTLRVNAERMWEALESGYSQATDLAEHVMLAAGIDYRTAYRIVGDTVRAASRQGRRGIDLTVADLDAAAVAITGRPLALDAAELASVLDPKAIVATRTASGGAAPAVTAEMADRYRREADGLAEVAGDHLAGYAEVERLLVEQVRALTR
jgi:argininosuccinate lyase